MNLRYTEAAGDLPLHRHRHPHLPLPTPTPGGPTPTPVPGSEQSIHTSQTPTEFVSDSYSSKPEIGVRFYANVPGNITKVKLYTNSSEGGNHTVRIWRYLPEGSPTLLAGPYTWNITSGTTGWRTYTLPTPLSISPYVNYIASVSNSAGIYAYTVEGYTGGGIDNGNLKTDYAAGLYSFAADAMPTDHWSSADFFRDIVFVPTSGTTPFPTPTPYPYAYVTPLPTGNNGIANDYHGDVNIDSDPDVVFFDNFDSYSTPSHSSGTQPTS